MRGEEEDVRSEQGSAWEKARLSEEKSYELSLLNDELKKYDLRRNFFRGLKMT